MSTSIPALFNSCFNALKSICSRLEGWSTSNTESLQLSRWQDELGRLRLWAANIGAHRTGQSSLEFRLKDSSHIREQVTNLLLDLGQTFQEVEHVLNSLDNGYPSQMEADDFSDDDYDTGEEMTQLHSNIVTAINCLFQMSMLVRKPARHDFYILPQSREVLAFRPFDQAHVREKYPEADQGLVERLGLAITLRRQYLRYRERHHAKLNQGLDIGTEGSAAPTVMLSDTVVTGVEPWHIDSQEKAPASPKSQTSYAPSMLAGGALVIPSPPKESSEGAPFECPYCFVIISVDGTPAWHKHVFQDLQPYICTVAACSTPHTLFSTRHEWAQHLKEAHPREWTGYENRTGVVINESDKSSFCAICPLCRSNSRYERHFVRHLARHLQELALFVLPQDDADSDRDDVELDDADSDIEDKPSTSIFGERDSGGSTASGFTPATHYHIPDEQQVNDVLSDIDFHNDFYISAAQPPREVPGGVPSPASRHRSPTLQEFFFDGTGIHPSIVHSKICKYLGPEAHWKPHYNGIQGYLVTARRPLTPAQLEDLRALSRAYESELRGLRQKGYREIPYEESQVHRCEDANLNHQRESRQTATREHVRKVPAARARRSLSGGSSFYADEEYIILPERSSRRAPAAPQSLYQEPPVRSRRALIDDEEPLDYVPRPLGRSSTPYRPKLANKPFHPLGVHDSRMDDERERAELQRQPLRQVDPFPAHIPAQPEPYNSHSPFPPPPPSPSSPSSSPPKS